MSSTNSRRLAFRSCAAAALMAFAAPVAAYAQEQTYQFNIPAQDLGAALRTFARQSRQQVAFDGATVRGKTSQPLTGSFSAETGLRKLLDGSGLSTTRGAQGVIMVRASTPQPEAAFASEPSAVSEVQVTGSRIRGVKDQFSPVTSFSRAEMDVAGYANVSDLVAKLPQNFGGGAARPPAPTPNTEPGAGAVGVNLRGLGNEATLVLLNGRRLAPSGLTGNFVDISSIPTSAIDRVEIVSDGASAIYGSDAIGGVMNIILRDDFEGAETRLNLSAITDGGGQTLKFGQTFGIKRDRYHALLTYEYSSEGELSASDKSWATNAAGTTWLLPLTSKHNLVLSSGVALSDRLTLSADAYYNNRLSKQFVATNAGQVTTYQQLQKSNSEDIGGSANLNIKLFGDWESDLTASYSETEFDSIQRVVQGPPGAISNTYDVGTDILSFDATVGGSLLRLRGEDVKGVFGVHYRRESLDSVYRLVDGTGTSQTKNSRDVYAGYGEIYAPIVSEVDEIPGINRLAVTLAARYENYSDVGSSFDPRVGLAYSPTPSLNVRATYGTSFRAARLSQLIDSLSNFVLTKYRDPQQPTPATDPVAAYVAGTTSQLDPEHATTWNVGFDYKPEFLDGLTVRATYFRIDYKDRIASPTITNQRNPFRIANFSGILVRNPSQEFLQQLRNQALSVINHGTIFPELGTLSIDQVSLFFDLRPTNLSKTVTSGIDFDVRYALPTDSGTWEFSVEGTYLDKFTQQFSAVTPVVDLLNTYGRPVDLRVRGGVQWSTDALSAAAFINYVDDYIDDKVTAARTPVKSWTTVDASLRFDLGEIFGSGVARDAYATFTITNVFNRRPPPIVALPLRADTFDSANADATGRRIGMVVTKRW
jgi:iron complex outermembrane recepter protein